MKHICLVGLIALTLSGCGGLDALGQNPFTRARITATDGIADLDLIISPLRGAPNAVGFCSQNEAGFGCSPVLGSDFTEVQFRTNSLASTSPFYAYARNNGTVTRRIALLITMDGIQKLSRAYDVSPGATLKIAEIRRTSADGP